MGIAAAALPWVARTVLAAKTAQALKPPKIQIPKQQPILAPDEQMLKLEARRQAARRRGSRAATTVLNQTAGGTGDRLGP